MVVKKTEFQAAEPQTQSLQLKRHSKIRTMSSSSKQNIPFLDAKESPLFLWVFNHWCRFLLRRRFRHTDVHVHYRPSPGARTIYFLNHHSWWDALIPIFLNQRYFGQRARGMMLEEQLRRFPFFRKVGVFSIRKGDPASALRSLRYSLESLSKPGNGMYIFPEGEICSFRVDGWAFEPGLAWLVQKSLLQRSTMESQSQTNNQSGHQPGSQPVEIVPIGVYTHCMWGSKPDLIITVGNVLSIPDSLLANRERLTDHLKEALSQVVRESVGRAMLDPNNRSK
jgi:1-acyl-sn-glycerol-3-phosphate acyltransferase